MVDLLDENNVTPLAGKTIAISISSAPDMNILGFPSSEVDNVLFRLCTAIIRAGGRILYGGNLDPDGYTFKIFEYIKTAYTKPKDKLPFIHLIAEPVFIHNKYEDLLETLNKTETVSQAFIILDNEVTGQLLCMDKEIWIRDDAGHCERLGQNRFKEIKDNFDAKKTAMAFSRMREIAITLSDARIIMGGKMGIIGNTADQYSGKIPGIAEETIYSLQNQQPIVLLGAYGGVSRDIAIELGLMKREVQVPRSKQVDSYHSGMKNVAKCKHLVPIESLEKLGQIANCELQIGDEKFIVKFLASAIANI
ncbi:MAG: hypothetical protein ABJN57_09365 [Hyphomicrobiales bacterium]